MRNYMPPDGTLEERLYWHAEETEPDKAPPLLRKIIEIRGFINLQRGRGHSWRSLTQMMAKEHLNLTEGTLRNYMAQIAKAEAELHAAGKVEPTVSDIHGALRRPPATPPRPQGPFPCSGKRYAP